MPDTDNTKSGITLPSFPLEACPTLPDIEAAKYLTRRQAASYLTRRGCKTAYSTLQKLACVGGGPPYRRSGNQSIYEPRHLDAYAKAKMGPLRLSTSEVCDQHQGEVANERR